MDTKSFFRKKRKDTSSSSSTSGPLAKLKFYCQQCSKQLRDANALKQHNLSPQHLNKTAKLNPEIISNYNNILTSQFLNFLQKNGGLTAWQEANKVIFKKKDDINILLKKPEGGEDLIEDGEYSKYMIKLEDNSSKNKMIENEVNRLEEEKQRQDLLIKDMLLLQREKMKQEKEEEEEQKEEKEKLKEEDNNTNNTKKSININDLNNNKKKKSLILLKNKNNSNKKKKVSNLFE
ncbi:hypothetical protein ACO0SA_004776 [Hanseniaspora valbyensis]